jgi:tRNA dimethylallyltransferase
VPLQDAHRCLIVAGPTASGKSGAALELALRLDGVVINADAMQVYRDLEILTARPSAAEEARAPHRLYGHVDAGERYSAGRFAEEAAGAVRAALEGGRLPILCGGTGLYLNALTGGLSPIPAVPDPVQAEVQAWWRKDPAGLRAELLRGDPAMARLEPKDGQRHMRALAVLKVSGRPLSSWQEEPRALPLPGVRFEGAWIDRPRGELYCRCEERFARMMAEGAAEEVARLLARGLDPSLPAMKSLGVPELAAMLSGELSEEEARLKAVQQTRRFAKRQTTWFSNQTGWPSFPSPDGLLAHLLGRAP